MNLALCLTYLLHTDLGKKYSLTSKKDIRFTKVLTKYSTEYNNYTYIQDICQRLSMDKKDMFVFFEKNKHKQEEPELYIYGKEGESKEDVYN